MLCKCSGKYIDIYFNLKITYQTRSLYPSHFRCFVPLKGGVIVCGVCSKLMYVHTQSRDELGKMRIERTCIVCML